jgi:hypothetical protein
VSILIIITKKKRNKKILSRNLTKKETKIMTGCTGRLRKLFGRRGKSLVSIYIFL